jgi:hypothetical protein
LGVPVRGVVIAVALCGYLAAALLPCPPQPGTSLARTTRAAMGADAGPRLVAPCPCGCHEHADGSLPGQRLGPALLTPGQPRLARVSSSPACPQLPRIPAAPPSLPDPVPLAVA